MSLRVAYLTNQLPWPPQSGGQLRELQILSRLDSTCAIHFLAVTEHLTRDLANLSTIPLNFASAVLEPALAHESLPAAPYRVRQHSNSALRQRVAQVIRREKIDVIHVEGFFLMQHVPETAVPVFLMTENVERFLEVELGTAPEIAAQAETDALKRATGIGAVSDQDAAFIEGLVQNSNVIVVPNGSDHLAHSARATAPAGNLAALQPYVLYVANFSWFPSLDGAEHLLKTLWPAIHQRLPQANLVLAGTMPDGPIKAIAQRTPGVTVTGFVDDLSQLYEHAEIVLCPCRIGGGTKIKMLEALSLGKPVIALRPCLEGLPAEVVSAVRTCESDDEFIDSTVSLLQDASGRGSLSRRALSAARRLPQWQDSAAALLAAWRDLARPALYGISAC